MAWPRVTILALVILLAAYAFIDAGLQAMRTIMEITAAFGPGRAQVHDAVHRARAGVGGVRRGVVRPPRVGAVTLALLIGLLSLIYGVSQIILGVEVRRTVKAVDSVLGKAA